MGLVAMMFCIGINLTGSKITLETDLWSCLGGYFQVQFIEV